MFSCILAPENVRAVFDTQTGYINVSWKDPLGSIPVDNYELSYNSPEIQKQNITGLKSQQYQFKPFVLGEIYKIAVNA